MGWQQVSAAQGGAVSRAQLLASGVSSSAIDRLLHAGHLDADPRWPGVYHAAGAEIATHGLAWSAVLGTAGVVSFRSAAQVWSLPVEADSRLHITVAERRRVDPRWGVRVHRVLLPGTSVTTVRGLPVTTRVETVFDCIGVLPRPASMTLADRALQQGWISESALQTRLRQQPGRWGNVRLREVLDQLDVGIEAESERRFHALLRSAGVTGWRAQFVVRGADGATMRLDVAFPARRLAVEIDGRAIHNTHERFGADRRRQNELVRLGWTVLRYTWDDIVHRPEATIAQLAQLLAA